MITVTPQTFTKVDYDAGRIADFASRAVAVVPGLPDDLRIDVRIDEDQATSRASIASIDPLVLDLDSGAIEDYRRPRELGESEAVTAVSRLLLEFRDRQDPEFGAPPLDAEPTLAHKQAWDVNLYGRLGRLGLTVHKPRYRYNFRNRHGFSDNADRIFEQLWTTDDLTWPRITALSDRATDTVITDL